MSFLDLHRVPSGDWQDWLDGSVAFDTDKGECVPLGVCEAAWETEREYWLGWGSPEDTTDCRLAYHSGVCRRCDMTEVEVVDRSLWYTGTSSGLGTRYELREDPGNALTLVACDLGDGVVEVWHDGYGI